MDAGADRRAEKDESDAGISRGKDCCTFYRPPLLAWAVRRKPLVRLSSAIGARVGLIECDGPNGWDQLTCGAFGSSFEKRPPAPRTFVQYQMIY